MRLRLTPYQKADLLTGIGIVMGLVALFPMSREMAIAYWAPRFDLPVEDAPWKWWLWGAWMTVMWCVGFLIPERILQRAHRHWRTTPISRSDLPARENRRQGERRGAPRPTGQADRRQP